MSVSSVEPYYSPQSDQLNSDRTIFRGSHRGCFLKKVFLKILEKSQENTCVGVSFFIKLQAWGHQLYCKRDSETVVFSVNLAKFLRTPFLSNTSGRLLLYFIEGRKKPPHFKLERIKLIWYTVMFLLETFIQNLVLGFFGPKKIRCKTRKRHT